MPRTIMRNLWLASAVAMLMMGQARAESAYHALPVTLHEKPAEVPDFTYLDANDTLVSIKKAEGKLVVEHFWATWCVPCVEELPEVEGLAARYGNKGVTVIPISLDGKNGKERIEKFFTERRIEALPVLRDDKNTAFRAVKGRVLPTTLFLKNGKEISRVNGVADWKSKDTVGFIEGQLR